MKNNTLNELKLRGYIAQITHEEEVATLLDTPGTRFYTGFDPTADSLHAGHLLAMMGMAHLQRAGLIPIALMGGATGLIGDPSGRSDLRQVMTTEMVNDNVAAISNQMTSFLDFSDGKAILVNNIDWISKLNYIEMLRDIGSCFSVNHMLTAECYRQRLVKGLTFLEFNYMIMQAYDFLHLQRSHNCSLQVGGDDQWSNILAGCDLVRRKEQKPSYGMTLGLLLTSEGTKMGKTAAGALWLDPHKCTPYDFYQYWRNINDADVITCLKRLTFLTLDEIKEYEQFKDAAINEAKKRLALEVTSIVHGRNAAENAATQAQALFAGGTTALMATTEITAADLDRSWLDLLIEARIIPSKSEGRRLVAQSGLFINEVALDDVNRCLTKSDLRNGEVIIRKGKKVHHRFLLQET